MKPLRRFMKNFYRKPISIMAWTPELVTLFNKLKVLFTSSSVLTIFYPDKPTLLKTYWRAEGMVWILMQLAEDEYSQREIRTVRETGEYLFDLGKNGARLKPIAFSSRPCTYFERKYHLFVIETA